MNTPVAAVAFACIAVLAAIAIVLGSVALAQTASLQRTVEALPTPAPPTPAPPTPTPTFAPTPAPPTPAPPTPAPPTVALAILDMDYGYETFTAVSVEQCHVSGTGMGIPPCVPLEIFPFQSKLGYGLWAIQGSTEIVCTYSTTVTVQAFHEQSANTILHTVFDYQVAMSVPAGRTFAKRTAPFSALVPLAEFQFKSLRVFIRALTPAPSGDFCSASFQYSTQRLIADTAPLA